jgi:WD40 repeat protein
MKVNCISFDRNCFKLVSGSKDQTVKIWNIKVEASEITLNGHKESVTLACFSIDGTKI